MAVVLNIFSNPDCTNIGQAISVGVAAFFNETADLNTWSNMNGIIYKNSVNSSDIVLSGGGVLYDYAIQQNLPIEGGDNTNFDYVDSSQSSKIWNPFYIGKTLDNISYCMCISCIDPELTPQYIVRLYAYRQTPDELSETRQSWEYTQFFVFGGMQFYGFDFSAVKFYRGVIAEQEFYFIVLNVKSNNEINSGETRIIGIPVELFNGRIPEPWTGQETESNSEYAYIPTIPYRGSVLPRDLTNKRNPYGFNSGNGLTLAVITFEEYAAILQGIYAGSAESVLNKLSQGWATIVGGNTHRPADEVQAITNAILACHMIPQLTGYISGSMTLRTIAGYHILGGNASESVTLSLWTTQNTIFEFETTTYYIQRRLNSFLDFEPYTTIILHLPFMPTVDIKPSILYGNGLKIHYKIDIFTGVLSADIMIVDNGNTSQDTPREFILTTLQTNVKTDIPIMGNAAQSGMFSSLTNALVSSVGAESYSGLIAGGIGAADMFSKMSTGQAVGQSKIDGIGAYLSNRQPYLIITRPNPANPPNYNQLEGIPSHMGGKIGDYFRANNSQNLQYTEFAAVDLSGIAATDQEKTEIESLLKSGVFI